MFCFERLLWFRPDLFTVCCEWMMAL
jgi:hypothetical protein